MKMSPVATVRKTQIPARGLKPSGKGERSEGEKTPNFQGIERLAFASRACLAYCLSREKNVQEGDRRKVRGGENPQISRGLKCGGASAGGLFNKEKNPDPCQGAETNGFGRGE